MNTETFNNSDLSAETVSTYTVHTAAIKGRLRLSQVYRRVLALSACALIPLHNLLVIVLRSA